VIHGPQRSPLIAQVIEKGSALSFAEHPDGWRLVQKDTGQAITSPMDDGLHHDVGYLAPLPWPDSRKRSCTSRVCTPMGASGVIHNLAHNLSDLYRDVRTRQF